MCQARLLPVSCGVTEQEKHRLLKSNDLFHRCGTFRFTRRFDSARHIIVELAGGLITNRRTIQTGAGFIWQNSELFKRLACSPVETERQGEDVTPLVDPGDVNEFIRTAQTSRSDELNDILYRAINFALPPSGQSVEVAFISLSAALESILTFFRRQGEYEILGATEFSELERDLKKWLKQHKVLAGETAKRKLIYEKFRELNRFPFSHIFDRFCEHYSLNLSDLWPVTGKHADWPLTEIRHRLVHGDPFKNRPVEAMACAQAHLRWTVERMLLCVLGWPVERSNVNPGYLRRTHREHQSWQAARSEFA
jgi:hypothetical protein